LPPAAAGAVALEEAGHDRGTVVFVVVVMAWRAMPLRLLKLMARLGRAVPRGCRPSPGGTPGPVRITGRELMTAATPRKFSAWSRWRA